MIQISDIIQKDPRFKKIGLEQVLRHVPYSTKELQGKCRERDLVFHRNLAMTVYYIEVKNLTRAGKKFNRHHATVIYAIKQIANAVLGFDKFGAIGINVILDKIESEEYDDNNLSYLEVLQNDFNSKIK